MVLELFSWVRFSRNNLLRGRLKFWWQLPSFKYSSHIIIPIVYSSFIDSSRKISFWSTHTKINSGIFSSQMLLVVNLSSFIESSMNESCTRSDASCGCWTQWFYWQTTSSRWWPPLEFFFTSLLEWPFSASTLVKIKGGHQLPRDCQRCWYLGFKTKSNSSKRVGAALATKMEEPPNGLSTSQIVFHCHDQVLSMMNM